MAVDPRASGEDRVAEPGAELGFGEPLGVRLQVDDVARALDGTAPGSSTSTSSAMYAASVPCFMPVPGGPSVADVASVVRGVAARTRIAGLGLTALGEGVRPEDVAPFVAAAGL